MNSQGSIVEKYIIPTYWYSRVEYQTKQGNIQKAFLPKNRRWLYDGRAHNKTW